MTLSLLYLFTSLVATGVYLATGAAGNTYLGDTVITVLAFSCLLLLIYLLEKLKINGRITAVCCAAGAAAGLILQDSNLLCITAFLVLHTIENLTDGRYFYQISAACIALILLIFSPEYTSIITLAVMLALFVIARVSLFILLKNREMLSESRREISDLKKKVSNLTEYAKTLKENSALEERSRFAVRIHDRLGHDISGSIILLEAAKLNIKTNPEQAEQCLKTATENLRSGVDEIRALLRQERPDINAVGISEIKSKLEQYKSSYNIDTVLEISGDTEKITFAVWCCIRDNLTEALTNTLKHSHSSKFTVSIAVMNKVIRVEMKDNGKGAVTFKKGMGLTAIEDRTVQAGGKCLFNMRTDGFHIINIFTL